MRTLRNIVQLREHLENWLLLQSLDSHKTRVELDGPAQGCPHLSIYRLQVCTHVWARIGTSVGFTFLFETRCGTPVHEAAEGRLFGGGGVYTSMLSLVLDNILQTGGSKRKQTTCYRVLKIIKQCDFFQAR